MKPIEASPEIDPGAPGLAHRIAAGVTPGPQLVLSFEAAHMPVPTDAELRIVAEVVSELAKLRGSFDKADRTQVCSRCKTTRPITTGRNNQSSPNNAIPEPNSMAAGGSDMP